VLAGLLGVSEGGTVRRGRTLLDLRHDSRDYTATQHRLNHPLV
jgi:hypothetical protein